MSRLGSLIGAAMVACLVTAGCGGGGNGPSALQRGQRLHDQLLRAGVSSSVDAQALAKIYGTNGGNECKNTDPRSMELLYNLDRSSKALVLHALALNDYCPSLLPGWLNVVGEHEPATRPILEDMLKRIGST
jgi:hypothetical protein